MPDWGCLIPNCNLQLGAEINPFFPNKLLPGILAKVTTITTITTKRRHQGSCRRQARVSRHEGGEEPNQIARVIRYCKRGSSFYKEVPIGRRFWGLPTTWSSKESPPVVFSVISIPSASLGNALELPILRPRPRPAESQRQPFHKPSGRLRCAVTFEKHGAESARLNPSLRK